MKKLVLFLLLGSIVVSCSDIRIDLDKEKENVALVLEKYVIANEEQDISMVKEIWASDSNIVVIGTNSDEKLIGWDAIRKVMERQFNSFEKTGTLISVRDQIIKINETGNTAWFSEILSYNYIYHGKAIQFEGLRFTGVLEKKDGYWYIVQSHMSIPGSPD